MTASETQRVVMCEFWADLHLDNGEVVPCFLEGIGITGDDKPENHVDYYTEKFVNPIFTGYYYREDFDQVVPYGEYVSTHVPDEPKDLDAPEAMGKGKAVTKVVRRTAVSYATVRYEMTERDIPVPPKNGRGDRPSAS